MKAIMLAPVKDANFILLPLQSEEGAQLQWIDGNTLCGGYWSVGEIPQANLGLVVIHALEATIKTMDADEKWSFVETITDDKETTDDKEIVTAMDASLIDIKVMETRLKACINAADTTDLKFATITDAKCSALKVCGVTEEQYRMVGGTL